MLRDTCSHAAAARFRRLRSIITANGAPGRNATNTLWALNDSRER